MRQGLVMGFGWYFVGKYLGAKNAFLVSMGLTLISAVFCGNCVCVCARACVCVCSVQAVLVEAARARGHVASACSWSSQCQ